MAWGSGPPGGSLQGTISLEGIPNLPGYRSTPCRPQKHRQTLQIRHGSMVVIGHRDPLPGSPGSTVRLDRSISRGSDARPARSFGDLTGRYSLIEQQKDALKAEQGEGRKLPFPKGRPLPKWLQYGKEQLTFKARSRRPVVLWVVSFSSLRPFGPRIASECTRNHTRNTSRVDAVAATMPRAGLLRRSRAWQSDRVEEGPEVHGLLLFGGRLPAGLRAGRREQRPAPGLSRAEAPRAQTRWFILWHE